MEEEKKTDKNIKKILNDEDIVFKANRKKHIAEVMEAISEQIKEFH